MSINNNPLSDEWVLERAQLVLEQRSKRRGLARLLPFLGPAFIAAVAYVDPGNFATNIQGGAQFGYMLLWVVLGANLMAMLIQTLSAKLGIATGKNLPENMRDHLPRPWMRYAYWIQAEVVAMSTDLAEFLGAALAFQLLLGIPLFWGAVLTAIISFSLLGLQRYGFRPLEAAIGAFILVIGACYVLEVIYAKPFGAPLLQGLLVPSFKGTESVLLAAGILGATVMPHVIYLHSSLTQSRIQLPDGESRRRLLRYTIVDVVIAMGLAGFVNMAMLAMAAATFHATGRSDVASIETAYQTLTPLLGAAAATAFAVSLLASGLSSSAVGTMAGQIIMQGFVNFSIPLWVRRTVTMLPAFAVILMGLEPTRALVLSQVVLSFGIPFALVPLLIYTSNKRLMGSLVNSRLVSLTGWVIAGLIIALNLFLLFQVITSGF